MTSDKYFVIVEEHDERAAGLCEGIRACVASGQGTPVGPIIYDREEKLDIQLMRKPEGAGKERVWPQSER